MTYLLTLAGPNLSASLILSLDEACMERGWRLLSAHVDESGLHALVSARVSAAKVAAALAEVSRLRLLGSMEWKASDPPPPPTGRTAFFVAAQ